MAAGRAQGRILDLCPGVGVGRDDRAGLAQLDVVQIEQVAVVGGGLYHIIDCAHHQQTAGHDAQTDQRCEGAAKELQHGMFALLARLLGCFGRFAAGFRFPAAVVDIDLTSH